MTLVSSKKVSTICSTTTPLLCVRFCSIFILLVLMFPFSVARASLSPFRRSLQLPSSEISRRQRKQSLWKPLTSSLSSSLSTISKTAESCFSKKSCRQLPRVTHNNNSYQNESLSKRAHGTTDEKRSFWTWSGGDDKRWKELRGGGLKGGEGDRLDTGSAHIDITQQDDEVALSSPSSPSIGSAPMSICTAQGYRSYMEDEFFCNEGTFCAVFDGHGGHQVSRYLRQNLYGYVLGALEMPTAPKLSPAINTTTAPADGNPMKGDGDADDNPATSTVKVSPDVEDYREALKVALEKVDREVQRISHWSFQGSTAVAVWIHENPTTSQRTMIAANIGDSRAVLCRDKIAFDLTRDHKPNDPIEQERIEAAGGKVIWCGDVDRFGEPIEETGVYRVNGNLALARAIGDRSERPPVTADPELTTAPINEETDQFILLATDGLWDVFSSGGAVDFVLEAITDGRDKDRIATLLVEEALRRGTYDNITVVILWLDR